MKYLLAGIILLLQITASFAGDYNSVIDTNKLPNPFEGQDNLYKKIFDELNSEYQHIGKRQADNIIENNKLSVIGGLNSIGLNYNRPFGEFGIVLDRNVSPEVTSDKWIVTDTFSIHIDASKVMRKLKDENKISLDDKSMAAFVGIIFKRTFTWVHFANSYEEGLSTHFEKLFFPFLALTSQTIAQLSHNEMIFKEDSISVNAGGFVSAPVYPGIGAMGGVLAKFQKMSRMEAISRDGESLQLTLEKSKLSSLGISMSLEALLFKALKFTLLSYDFEYEHASSYKIYTDFKISDLKVLSPTSPVALEINKILKEKEVDLTVLAPYIISEEKKISQSIAHRYHFLIFSGSKKSKTEQKEIVKDGRVKTFFSHYFEKIKYTESLLSKIFASIISALTQTSSATAKLASETTKVEIIYDSDKNLLEAHQDIDIGKIGDKQTLSLKFTGEFMTKKTDGAMGNKYKDRAVFAVNNYTGLDPLVGQMIGRGYLKAPILIQGHYQVHGEGIRHFNSLPVSTVFESLSSLCDDKPKNKFFNFKSLFSNCKKSLEVDYINYLMDLSHSKITSKIINECMMLSTQYGFNSAKKRAFIKKCIGDSSAKDSGTWTVIPLWPLKNISQNIVNNSKGKIHFYNLFGIQNVFFFGSIDAMTSDDRQFMTTFHEGAFKGFGVVDNYLREENLRSPASVVLDQ